MRELREFVSYAQHGEDVILWRTLGHCQDVFYVDVGAFDPTYDSVTRALYERGWRGINIEPQPDRIAAFLRERPEDINLNLAIGERDGTATLSLPANPGWATIVDHATRGDEATGIQTLEVPVRRLDTLLNELGIHHVDVLKIDVEGAEASVVRGLLDGPVRPLVCVIEGVSPHDGRTAGDEAVRLLVAAGYVHCLFDGLNHYLTTDPSLRESLSVPANPVDGYTTDLVRRMQAERAQLHATVAALASENVALRSASEARVAMNETVPAPGDGEPRVDSSTEATETEPDGSDLPLPAADPLDAAGEPAPPPRAPQPAPIVLDRAVRSARRRLTFAALLKGEAPALPRKPASPLARLLRLSTTEHTPSEAISVLYREILGRDADPEGLAAWSRKLEAGETAFEIARELASSREALDCPPDLRARVSSDLNTWESLLAVTELGIAAWRPGHAYSPGTIAHEIFVDALFEVALQRPPSPAEASLEIRKLADGVGREWLLRAYAARPELRIRLLGRPPRGMRARLRRARDERHYLERVRQLVVVAESRLVERLLANLSTSVSGLSEIRSLPPTESQEH